MVDVRSSPTLRIIPFLIAACHCERSVATCHCERSAAIRFRVCVATAAFFLAIVSTATAKYSGGTGEPNDPYQIATAADLIALGETPEDYDKHFILTADLDLDPKLPGRKVFDKAVIAPDMDPCDTDFWGDVLFTGPPFAGIFDGGGHTISNLTIRGGSYLGLFGQLGKWGTEAEVRNLGVGDVNIIGSGRFVGGLVGDNWYGNISTSYSTGEANGNSSVGGLVGINCRLVTQCCSTVTVNGSRYVGGLVGENSYFGWVGGPEEGRLIQCYSTGAVSGKSEVGGLVGANWGAVTQCYSTGAVIGSAWVGGLNGCNWCIYEFCGEVIGCYWDIQTSGQTKSDGGTGLTTAQMKDPNTFRAAGWDFVGPADGPSDIWAIPQAGGCPVLGWQLSPWPALPRFSGGTGEPNDPYRIGTANDLNSIGCNSRLLKCHFKMVADLDLLGTTFYPIGDYYCAYRGVFDGNGHTISHLTIKGKDNLGVFGYLGSGAKVRDLGVVDANVVGSGTSCVGGLAGCSAGDVTDCYSTGAVSGGYAVGGLVGLNYGSLTDCYSTGVVSGSYWVGGLVGSNAFGAVTHCYSTGMVAGNSFVGGLVGYNESGAVTGCYSTSAVRGNRDVGGLLGANLGDVTGSFWDIQASGQAMSDGGTGKTTAEMQTAKTFLDGGWDFVGETANGTEDTWKIVEGVGYPHLSWEKYGGGTGEPNDPYQIATAADLIALGEEPNDYDKHFILTADIDLDPNLPGRKVFDRAVIAPDTNVPSSWFEGTDFTGVFDGNGHTISHLTIRGGRCLGLFGQLSGDWVRPGSAGQVKNLGVVDVSIIGTGDLVGGLAGYDDSGTVTQCYSSGVVSGNSYVGGLVGMESSPTPGLPSFFITYSYSNCYSTAAVSAATGSAGGLVGWNSCGNIIRCYSTGPVSAPAGAGGLVGEGAVIVTDCFWDIETSGQAASAGGNGKTTQEMQAASTFVQWGACVSVWTIDDGRDYPRLAWEDAPGQIIAGPTYAGGTGTAEDPYLIATAEDLNALGLCSCHWGRHFTLTADIDLSGRTWTGSVVPGFWGVFDGNGHVISGLTITGGSYLGLFGLLGSLAYVKDLGVVDVNIISSGNSVGGLVGENYGSIVASYSSGAISSTSSQVGGLVGMHEAGDVSRCYSTCGVRGACDVGGLVGLNYGGTVTQCYSAGSVRGNPPVGGLVGSGNKDHVSNGFWDTQTSGQTTSAGGTGKTTAEMQTGATFLDAGWDFVGETKNGLEDIWKIAEGLDYPRLWWELTEKKPAATAGE
jgi:hypothetical protein